MREAPESGDRGPVDLVLVHGAFHGPWCFEAVEPLFYERGFHPIAVELPLETLAGDVEAVRDVLDDLERPAVLLGHSYGGAVITWAGVHPAVSSLIYVAAVMPDAGEGIESGMSDEQIVAAPDLFESDPGGALRVNRSVAADIFYGDAEPAKREAWASRLRPGNVGFGEVVPHAAWRFRPSDYVVCLDDVLVPAATQRWVAGRAGAVVHELPGRHSPFLVRPGAFVELVAPVASERSRSESKSAITDRQQQPDLTRGE
jgi:pimeloyl-ACP methyl ester carboxylesterase